MPKPHFFRNTNSNRRHFLKAIAAGGAFFWQPGAYAQAVSLTPAQTEGPYYPNRLPLDQDNDLLLINDAITPAMGTVAWLSGRVLDRNGSPARNALVEIWQADNLGSYIHTSGALNGRRDGNFQGYGRFLTASDGTYLFRTIRPGLYPGRVRHVHVKVTLPGRILTTQLYIQGETGNDGVLNAIPSSQRSLVVRPWTPIPNSPIGALSVNWDIALNYTPATTPTSNRPTLVSMAGIVDGASLRAGAGSGSWVTVMGTSLSNQTRVWGAEDFVGGRLPESLDEVSVKFDDQPASVYYISPNQINVLAPEFPQNRTAQVTVTRAGNISTPVSVEVRRFLPAFFQFPNEYVAAVRSDGALLAPAGLIPGANTIAAHPGDTILLFGTGFGPTSPQHPVNQVNPGPLPTANPVKVQIENQSVPVAFAGIVSPGLYQLNVTVPDLPDGDYPVSAEVAGVRTPKFVRLRIQRSNNVASAGLATTHAAGPSAVMRYALAQQEDATTPFASRWKKRRALQRKPTSETIGD